MILYITKSGTALDLEHVLAVGPVLEDWHFSPPYVYHLTLAFGSRTAISADNREDADACHDALITAWSTACPR